MALLMQINLSDYTFTGQDKKEATVNSKLINYTTPLEEANNYVYRVNGDSSQVYTCNYVLDGTSWVTFSYKVNDLDAISCKVNKSDNSTVITIRTNLVDVDVTNDILELFLSTTEPKSVDITGDSHVTNYSYSPNVVYTGDTVTITADFEEGYKLDMIEYFNGANPEETATTKTLSFIAPSYKDLVINIMSKADTPEPPTPTAEGFMYAIVRFTNTKAVKLTYDKEADTVELEEV